MSSNQKLDALAAARSQNASLRKIIVLVAALGAAGMYFAHAVPRTLDLHLAPDLKTGDSVRFVDGQAPIPDVNVYGFAYYIWQQLNRWQSDGSKNYGEQMFRMQSYVTPSCMAQLQADMQQRHRAGELRSRTRHMTEIPGFGYTAKRVVAEGRSAWTVLLDMQLMESFRGQPVKDTYIRYPIRVVRYDVDREKNPWRLAIDCYGAHRPTRLDSQDVQAVMAGQSQPKLPENIVPPSLPKVGDTHEPGLDVPVTEQPEQEAQTDAAQPNAAASREDTP